MKHTQGPWEIESEGLNILALDHTRTWRIVASARATFDIDGEANAKLIAAAPEMLEILLGLDFSDFRTEAAYEHVQSVIRKATNQNP